jgi:ABC-type lipoprotein release transport system permease subunit
MAAVWYRFRAELRTRWRAWLALALIVGIAGAAVLALAAGARRTDSAYQRFLRSQNAYDVLLVTTSDVFGAETSRTAQFDLDEVRRLPEVAETARGATFFVFVGAGVGVLIPKDERMGNAVNRFKMLEGRRPDPRDPSEVVVSFTFADQYGLGVGDQIPLLDEGILAEVESGEVPPDVSLEEAEAFRAAADRVLTAIPDNALTIVGVEAAPSEFPPQIEGTGRYLVHTSPALYPLRADIGTFSEGADTLMVRLHGGQRAADAFLDRLEQLGGGLEPNATLARDPTKAVDRTLDTQAVALQILALLTGLVAVLICGQLLARFTALESTEHPVLSALGMGARQRFALGTMRAAAIGAVGMVIAVAVAAALSPVFPTGLARTAEPESGLRIDGFVLGVGAIAVALVVVLLVLWPAWRATRAAVAPGPTQTRTAVTARALADRGAPLPVSTGVRMALEPGQGRSAVPVRSSLVGVTLGVITLVAALTFGASLGHLLATPRLYGQTWDVEFTTYDDTMFTRGASLLERDDRVDGVALGNFRIGFDVDGHAVDGLAVDRGQSDISPTILEGRGPRGPNEIVLGTRTLREIDADVSDTVEVGLVARGSPPVRMRVVGRAVFPVFAIAGQLGDGALMTLRAAERISEDLADPFDTSVLVQLAPGADLDELSSDLDEQIGDHAFVIGQGKPTDILNFGRVEGTPYILGAILAALSLATLTHLLLSATRRKRRDLAILKTLGFVRRQVRSAVGWQATTLIVISLAVGIPLGIAVGRWIWTLFADELGVVVEPQIPWLGVVLLVPIAVVVANVIARWPARIAARTPAATVLRSE